MPNVIFSRNGLKELNAVLQIPGLCTDMAIAGITASIAAITLPLSQSIPDYPVAGDSLNAWLVDQYPLEFTDLQFSTSVNLLTSLIEQGKLTIDQNTFTMLKSFGLA
jgi:hypothetical protein